MAGFDSGVRGSATYTVREVLDQIFNRNIPSLELAVEPWEDSFISDDLNNMAEKRRRLI